MFLMRLRRASERCGSGFCRAIRRSLGDMSFLLILVLASFVALSLAQDQGFSAPPKGQQEPPDSAGGPQSDVGQYAIPKKKDEPPPPPPREKPKKIEGMPDYSIRVDVPVVEVPVMVTTKDGQFISNLKKEN